MPPLELTLYFTTVKTELAHTNAEVIWHEQSNNYAAVLSMLPQEQAWYHLFAEIDGEWLPVESSFVEWIAYDKSEIKGVLMNLTRIDKSVGRGRVEYRGTKFESEVSEGYLCSVIWDCECPNRENDLKFLELLVEDSWKPCIVSYHPTTAKQFAQAYLRHYAKKTNKSDDEDWWAVDLFFTTDQEERLELALTVIEYADLDQDRKALGNLGAGPLEDLMSHWLLDNIESMASNNSKLKFALSIVRMDFEEETLQKRVSKLL